MSRSLYGWMKRRRMPRIDALTRRQLLERSAAGAAALLLSGCGFLGRADSRGGRRIVVVGGGFAGLVAAHELRAAGYAVTLVEARSRTGGRVLTFGDFVPGRVIEGGGELIGSNHPHWIAWAERFGLEFLDIVEPEEAEFPIVLRGERLAADAVDALYEEMDAALSQLNALAEPIDADAPWRSADARALDLRSTADWVAELAVSELCKAGIRAQLEADNGAPLERQSLLANLAQVKGGGLDRYWTDSEVWRCKGGNQQLATALQQAFTAAGGTLRLGARVQRIDQTGAAVRVTLTDGTALDCEDVVLATPPTTWDAIEFAPALPPELAPQLGVNTKYLMHVKGRFWEAAGLAADGLTDGPIGWTWDATHGQAGDGPACLTAFSGARGAETVRGWPVAERDARFRAEYARLFPDVDAQFVAARFMDWPSDPLTRGGYSIPAPGQITTCGPQLRSGHGRLHFAGEHCSHAFVGYMEGALESGAAVAKRIAVKDGVAQG
ncbi:MAG: FAD-dependent oxidoreductase [Planctomycetes bacterium]|nr:FAD-dependent oxidoreductase [Planctomycetota bacterium]